MRHVSSCYIFDYSSYKQLFPQQSLAVCLSQSVSIKIELVMAIKKAKGLKHKRDSYTSDSTKALILETLSKNAE